MRTVDPKKHKEKRDRILEAAGRCFARDGLRGASISEICAEADISAGHLYHYFASKEAIVGAMVEARLEHAAAMFTRMLQGDNAITALVAEMDQSKKNGHRALQLLVLDMLAEAGRNPAIGEMLRTHSKRFRAMLGDFLRQGQQRGHIDQTLDADMAASILMSVSDGMKTMHIRDPKVDMAKSIDLIKTLITRFLTPAPDRTKSK